MIEAFDIPDLLPRLVDRSLVSYDEASGRYTLLETVRQYAAEHALNFGDSATVRERHLAYFLDLLHESQQKVRGAKQAFWLRRYDEEYDNIRIALDWVMYDPARWPLAVDMAYELVDYWMIRSAYSESSGIIERLRPLADSASPVDRVKFLMVEQATQYYISKPLPEAMIEAAAIAKELGDEGLRANALGNLTIAYERNGMFEEAIESSAEALRALNAAGNWTMEAFVHMNLGNQALTRKMFEVAKSHYAEALRIRREHGDLRGIGASTGGFAEVAHLEGNIPEAIRLHRQSLSIFSVVGSDWDISGILPGAALEMYQAGNYSDAAMVIGFSDHLLNRLNATRDEADGAIYDLMVSQLVTAMGDVAFKDACKQGQRLTLKSVLALLFPDGLDVPEEYLALVQGSEYRATA